MTASDNYKPRCHDIESAKSALAFTTPFSVGQESSKESVHWDGKWDHAVDQQEDLRTIAQNNAMKARLWDLGIDNPVVVEGLNMCNTLYSKHASETNVGELSLSEVEEVKSM